MLARVFVNANGRDTAYCVNCHTLSYVSEKRKGKEIEVQSTLQNYDYSKGILFNFETSIMFPNNASTINNFINDLYDHQIFTTEWFSVTMVRLRIENTKSKLWNIEGTTLNGRFFF